MKIRATTVIAIIVILICGVYIYSRKDSTKVPSSPIVLENVKPSPLPEATPGRKLKEGEKFIGTMSLYVVVPEDMNFRQDPATEHAVNFYIESGSEDKPTYQLYTVYQPNKNMAVEGLEQAKKDMSKESIKEAVVGGYRGIEGLVTGPKGRYQTIIVKDDKLMSFSTYPPTEENKAITDQILSSVSFE